GGAEWTVRKLGVERVVKARKIISAPHFDLVVDARSFGDLEHDVPQRRPRHPPHRQSTRQTEDSLRKVYLVGLAAEEECNLAAFDDRDFAMCEEAVHRSFVNCVLLLEQVDGQTAVARSGGPILRTSEATAHCAYTCTLR